MENKWKEVVNRNKKKKVFALQAIPIIWLCKVQLLTIFRKRISLFISWNILKKNPNPKKRTKKKKHLTAPTDTRPFKGADQLRPEIILLHQKILNYISIITELIYDFSNRTHICTSSGISFPYFVSQIFAY